MRLLEPLARRGIENKPEARLDQEFFHEHLQKAKDVGPFTFNHFPASGAGEKKLFDALNTAVFGQAE